MTIMDSHLPLLEVEENRQSTSRNLSKGYVFFCC